MFSAQNYDIFYLLTAYCEPYFIAYCKEMSRLLLPCVEKLVLLRGEECCDGAGFGWSYHFGEVGLGLQAHLFQAAEVEQEVSGGLLADAGDVGEGGAEGAL